MCVNSAPRVRIPVFPPNKDRCFDTERIETTVFIFCIKTVRNVFFSGIAAKTDVRPDGFPPRAGVVFAVLMLEAIDAIPAV